MPPTCQGPSQGDRCCGAAGGGGAEQGPQAPKGRQGAQAGREKDGNTQWHALPGSHVTVPQLMAL